MNSSQLSKEQPPRWLDIVLKGKSAAVKAKVMEVTTKMGIDPDDEFFVIFVALGQFLALLEKCPTQWEKLFTEFQGDLRQWGEDFRAALSQTSANTDTLIVEIEERLKESVEALEEGFNRIDGHLEKADKGLNRASRLLMEQNSKILQEIAFLKQKNEKILPIVQRFVELMDLIEENSAESQNSENFLPPRVVKWIESHFFNWLTPRQWLIVSYGLVFLISLGWARAIYLPDKQLTEKMAQQTQWLLEKANRRDCLDQIKSPDSPECQKVFPHPQK